MDLQQCSLCGFLYWGPGPVPTHGSPGPAGPVGCPGSGLAPRPGEPTHYTPLAGMAAECGAESGPRTTDIGRVTCGACLDVLNHDEAADGRGGGLPCGS